MRDFDTMVVEWPVVGPKNDHGVENGDRASNGTTGGATACVRNQTRANTSQIPQLTVGYTQYECVAKSSACW
jgi:hypothetical protein